MTRYHTYTRTRRTANVKRRETKRKKYTFQVVGIFKQQLICIEPSTAFRKRFDWKSSHEPQCLFIMFYISPDGPESCSNGRQKLCLKMMNEPTGLISWEFSPSQKKSIGTRSDNDSAWKMSRMCTNENDNILHSVRYCPIIIHHTLTQLLHSHLNESPAVHMYCPP